MSKCILGIQVDYMNQLCLIHIMADLTKEL